MSEQKIAHYVSLVGCDDSNGLFFEMTKAENDFLTRLATALNDNASYNCEPKLRIDDDYPESEAEEEDE
jgi:hypothetical protein